MTSGGALGGAGAVAIVTAAATTNAAVAVTPICWIEAADNYARIWTGGRSYLVREPLHDLEARARRSGFARAHRSALVRLGAVRGITSTADGLVAIVGDGGRVPISRRHAAFAAALRRACGGRP